MELFGSFEARYTIVLPNGRCWSSNAGFGRTSFEVLDSFSLARDVPMFALFVVHIERHWGKDGLPQLRVRDIPPFSIVPEDAVQFI